MSTRTDHLPQLLYDYLADVSFRETSLQKELRVETSRLREARMQISPEQGQFFQVLLPLINAKRTLEIGVFTGYSTLCTALALPPDGQVTACDLSEEWTAIARKYWRRAGVDHLIDLQLGPATQTLIRLIESGKAGAYDFAFIDADKERYVQYYEYCLQLVRPNGLIVIDNTLWSGKVADPNDQEPDTVAIRQFNHLLKDDERVDISLLPIGDGLTLARKR